MARLTIDNPTAYQLNIELTDGGRHRWFDLGAVGPERNKTVQEVADQGEQWVFRLSYGGMDAGEVVVARSELAPTGWRVTIPVETGDRLHAAGLLMAWSTTGRIGALSRGPAKG